MYLQTIATIAMAIIFARSCQTEAQDEDSGSSTSGGDSSDGDTSDSDSNGNSDSSEG